MYSLALLDEPAIRDTHFVTRSQGPYLNSIHLKNIRNKYPLELSEISNLDYIYSIVSKCSENQLRELMRGVNQSIELNSWRKTIQEFHKETFGKDISYDEIEHSTYKDMSKLNSKGFLYSGLPISNEYLKEDGKKLFENLI